jgi:hypothetical protein
MLAVDAFGIVSLDRIAERLIRHVATTRGRLAIRAIHGLGNRDHPHRRAPIRLMTGWTSKCQTCPLKDQCTTGKERRLRRWEHESLIEALSLRMEAIGYAMAIRREVVEHPFATIKGWMGATHFLCKGLKAIRTEMSLHLLAYNFRRLLSIIGVGKFRAAIAT